MKPVETTSCSNADFFTLSSLGLTGKEFSKLGDLSHKLPIETICKIFDMTVEELREVYRQAGIHRPFIEPLSMEGIYYALLWLYASGRATYGLNAYGKIEYTCNPHQRPDRALVNAELMDRYAIMSRIQTIIQLPSKFTWLLKYMADELINGGEDDRRAVLVDLVIQGRYTLCRQEYLPLDPFIDMDKIRYKRRRICYSKMQMYCILDRLRLAACHDYKGSREDFLFALKGSGTRRSKVMDSVDIIVPNMDQDKPSIKMLLKCLKLAPSVVPEEVKIVDPVVEPI